MYCQTVNTQTTCNISCSMFFHTQPAIWKPVRISSVDIWPAACAIISQLELAHMPLIGTSCGVGYAAVLNSCAKRSHRRSMNLKRKNPTIYLMTQERKPSANKINCKPTKNKRIQAQVCSNTRRIGVGGGRRIGVDGGRKIGVGGGRTPRR